MSMNHGIIAGLKRALCIRDRERILHLLMMETQAVCAEIGVQDGYHADDMVRLTRPRELHLIDPCTGGSTRIKRTWEGGPAAIHIHGVTSDDWFASNPPKLDWIYIDGDHSEEQVYKDVSNAANAVKVGGYIIGDDYGWASVRRGVKRAIKDCISLRSRFVWHTQFMVQVT